MALSPEARAALERYREQEAKKTSIASVPTQIEVASGAKEKAGELIKSVSDTEHFRRYLDALNDKADRIERQLPATSYFEALKFRADAEGIHSEVMLETNSQLAPALNQAKRAILDKKETLSIQSAAAKRKNDELKKQFRDATETAVVYSRVAIPASILPALFIILSITSSSTPSMAALFTLMLIGIWFFVIRKKRDVAKIKQLIDEAKNKSESELASHLSSLSRLEVSQRQIEAALQKVQRGEYL